MKEESNQENGQPVSPADNDQRHSAGESQNSAKNSNEGDGNQNENRGDNEQSKDENNQNESNQDESQQQSKNQENRGNQAADQETPDSGENKSGEQSSGVNNNDSDGQKSEKNDSDGDNNADDNSNDENSDDSQNADEDNGDTEEKSKPNWFLRIALIAAGVLLLVLLLVFGIVPRIRRDRETKEAAKQKQNALPIVNFVKPQSAPDSSDLVLPGTTQAVQETAVNARASGYLTHRYVDIGDKVRAGQLLAEIDTPEIDEQLRQAQQQVMQAQQQVAAAQQDVAQAKQQLNQARAGLQTTNAQLKQARTNQQLANVTARRSNDLAQKGLVSQQEADQNNAALDARKADTEVAVANINDRQANIGAAQAVINNKQAGVGAQQANVNALKANVRRLEDLQGFRRITAPFSGVVTARNIDVGGLVSAGGTSSNSTNGTDNSSGGSSGGSSAGGSSTGSSSGGSSSGSTGAATGGLFRIARLEAMRTYVNVPQTYAAQIKAGLPTLVDIKDLPQKEFKGRVTRTSNSLDPNSRTLLAEVLIDNVSGQLLPGLYAQIKFSVPHPVPAVLIPSSALIARPDGSSVIVVHPDNTIHYQKVEVGRDYGKQIEIIDGLEAETAVVTNPTDSMQENTQVDARPAPPENANQQGGNQPGGNNQQPGSQPNQPPQNNPPGSQPPSSGGSGGK